MILCIVCYVIENSWAMRRGKRSTGIGKNSIQKVMLFYCDRDDELFYHVLNDFYFYTFLSFLTFNCFSLTLLHLCCRHHLVSWLRRRCRWLDVESAFHRRHDDPSGPTTTTSLHQVRPLSAEADKAVIDRRLRPLCCYLGSYFKRPKNSLVRPLACNWYYRSQFIAKPKAALGFSG